MSARGFYGAPAQMTLPPPCTPASIAPARRTRAGWNQALLTAAGATAHQLTLDLDGPERLDAGLIACLAPVDQELGRRGGLLRIATRDPLVRAVIAISGMQRLLPPDGGVPLDLTCSAVFADDDVRVIVQQGIGLNPRLSTPASHTWLARVAVKRAVVDLGELSHVNSVIVAWLLQLAQAAKPADFVLANVNRQVAIQFNQLRLNHVLQVQPSEEG
jgi:anti-anti-sigma regulatory factor